MRFEISFIKIDLTLKLTCLCLEHSEVLWRDFGGAVTIHCRSSEPQQGNNFHLKKGLNEDFLTVDKSNKITVTKNDLLSRLHVNGTFPNVDFVIKNLKSEDTGLYWCGYKSGSTGSDANPVVLVVKGEANVFYFHLFTSGS